jgi:hypothetical protein
MSSPTTDPGGHPGNGGLCSGLAVRAPRSMIQGKFRRRCRRAAAGAPSTPPAGPPASSRRFIRHRGRDQGAERAAPDSTPPQPTAQGVECRRSTRVPEAPGRFWSYLSNARHDALEAQDALRDVRCSGPADRRGLDRRRACVPGNAAALDGARGRAPAGRIAPAPLAPLPRPIAQGGGALRFVSRRAAGCDSKRPAAIRDSPDLRHSG